MRPRLRWFPILLFAAAAIFLIIAVASHFMGRRNAWRRYTAELRAKGEKLTWAELGLKSSTDSNELFCLRTFTNENFDVIHMPTMREYVGPGKARVAWRENRFWEAGATNSIATNWDVLLSEVDSNAIALAVFRKALEHPTPDLGARTNLFRRLASTFHGRTVAAVSRGLSGSLIADLHGGRNPAALGNLEALIAMQQMFRNDPQFAPGYRTLACRYALDATWEILQFGGWSDDQLSALQSDWQAINVFDELERFTVGQRIRAFELEEEIRNLGISGRADLLLQSSSGWSGLWNREVALPYYMTTGFSDDALWLLQRAQDRVEAARLLKYETTWPKVHQQLQSAENAINASLRGSGYADYRLRWVALGISPLSFYRECAYLETERRLCVTDIACKRYQLRHGHSPPGLAALVPEFLKAVPIDPMSGRPICYRLNSDGTVVLYSVGEDGHDDGGDPTPSSPKVGPGLWTGRDAVWPAPVSVKGP